MVKLVVLLIFLIGVLFAVLFTWTNSVKILLFCMLADYLIGLSLSIIGKGKKGKLKSSIGREGIVKKTVMLFVTFLLGLLEPFLQINFLQDLVVFAFIFNELVSINEHAEAVGLPLTKIFKAILRKEK